MHDIRLLASGPHLKGAALEVPGGGPRRVTAIVYAYETEAGWRFGAPRGTEKGIQLVLRAEEDCVIELRDEGRVLRRRAVSGERSVRLTVRVIGDCLDAYVEGHRLGRVRRRGADRLSASLIAAGIGAAAFSGIRQEPIEPTE
jgi:hypothetical protein